MALASLFTLPEEVAEGHARNAIIDLATRAPVIKRTLHLTQGAGRDKVLVVIQETDVVLHSVEEVQYPYCGKLDPVSCVNDVACTHRSYFYEKPTLWLNPAAQACDAEVEVVMRCIPDQYACDIDECVFKEHSSAISDYVVGKAQNMPSFEEYNPQASALAARVWDRYVSSVAALHNRNHSRQPLKPKPGAFL